MTSHDTESGPSPSPALFDQLREELSPPPPAVDEAAEDDAVTVDQQTAGAMAANNHGIPHEARRALISLMRHGVILGAQKSALFATVCRHQDSIRRHLSEVYLKLMLDEKMGVAFIAAIGHDTDDEQEVEEEYTSLIVRRTLTLYDTLLLLVLRKYYQERETAGEQKVVTDIEQIESWLIPFLPLTTNSRADRKKLSASLKKMTEKKLLSVVRGSEDRYEITPIIRYVVNADLLGELLEQYQRMVKENSTAHDLAQSSTGDSGHD